MAEGLNKVMLLGNLGADPELKTTQGGQAVLKLRLATTESYVDKNQARQEKTEWHSVTLWGKRGEALAKFLKKGDRIFVEGGLRTSSYEKNGEKRYSTEINATNVILAGGGAGRREGEQQETSRSRGGPAPDRTHDRAPPPPRAAPQDDFGGQGGYGGGGDDEIPF
jgi:single-strand DNA-binding protein